MSGHLIEPSASLFSGGYRSRWLNLRGFLAIRAKRYGERLSWWLQP